MQDIRMQDDFVLCLYNFESLVKMIYFAFQWYDICYSAKSAAFLKYLAGHDRYCY